MNSVNECASSGEAHTWDQVDWPQCEHHVRRIQARIVKATREGRWHKVKALQWLLTHSFSGRALAVKRVTENKGKRRGWMVGHGKPRRRSSNRLARCGGAVINRNRCAVSISRKPMEN